MKRELVLSALLLLISLCIYIIWRGNDILVNKLLQILVSSKELEDWKTSISSRMPLNNYLIYSLPGSLWTFVATSASRNFYVNVRKSQFNLLFLPIIFILILELLQLFHVTHGTFDWVDLVSGLVFWAASIVIIPASEIKDSFLDSQFNLKKIWVYFVFLIVYLAHLF